MAQISLDSIKRIEKYRNTIHDKVYTTYTTFEADGEKYVQIDTYGRIGRENPEKISRLANHSNLIEQPQNFW